jgi:hypothetical protein
MPTPYVIALLEAVIFTASGAAATLATAFLSPYRHLLAFAWRTWLWGSIGLIICNLALLALLFYFASGVGIAGGALRRYEVRDVLLSGLLLFGPLIFSSVGVILGCTFGWRLARRRLSAV